MHPRITIVTPSYNQGRYLEKCILSVIEQNYPNLEYMIIDGGSTDESVEIIKKYEKHLSYWVSEKDRGQSDAINRGLSRSSGDIFNWLCSDDYLEQGSLMHIAQIFQADQNVLCYAGKLRMFSENGNTVGYYGNMLQDNWQQTIRMRVLKQPAVYFSRLAVNRMGPLNEKLHYCMDADWLYRFFFLFKMENVAEDEQPVAHYLLHAASKSGSQGEGFVRESDSIIHSFAVQKELTEYANLLERSELIDDYVFPKSILDQASRELVEQVVHAYLLRKSTKIYTRKDFQFARTFLSIRHSISGLAADQLLELKFLKKYVQYGSWFIFKLRRAYLWHVKKENLSLELYLAN